MAGLPDRHDIKIGLEVQIETKKDQGTGRLTAGIVGDILTANISHPHGIKVRLRDGQVGRVKKIAGSISETPAHTFENLNAKPIPKTEDKYNEFKEFYQYDKKIETFSDSMDAKARRKAIEGLKHTVRERFATAVCSFGNDRSGGFIYLGIREDGTVAGLKKDREMGDFDNYDDDFANHIQDTIENFIKDKVFVIRNIQIKFKSIDNRTICIVQVLPANSPLYLHTAKGQVFYVRGPSPRAERITSLKEQFKYIKSRFPKYG